MLGKSVVARIEAAVDGLDALDPAGLVDLVGDLEAIKNAASAAQARAAVAFDQQQRAEQARAGVPMARRGEGVAAQLGLARQESPAKASRLLGLAKVLDAEMPHTLDLMSCGALSEWRATLVARETACLSLEHRKLIDRWLCRRLGDRPAPAEAMSDAELVRAARRRAVELDNAAVAARFAKAGSERTVTIRPAPDGMAWVTGLLPVKQGVAVWVTLSRAADAARAVGDPRSRGQVMADTLYERVTGRPSEQAVSVQVHLVMTDRTLFAGDDGAVQVPGYGPVPADWARDTAAAAADETRLFLRRLYTSPGLGTLTRMDSRSRLAPSGLADFIRLRDQGICRTPWCGAPIRHIDHAEGAADGGPTTERNLQGLCEHCNHVKQARGWRSQARHGPGPHQVEITTPTGHRYRSRSPDPPGARRRASNDSYGEALALDLVIDIDRYRSAVRN